MSFKTTFTLSEVYNKQLSGIWPTAFYDYFEKTSLLIGTNETTFITDASTNNWTLTPAAIRANNEHPYQPGYYSTYFATSADYVTTSAIFMGATAFTVECWVNTTNKTAYAGICKNGAAADWTVTDIFVIGLDSSGNSIWVYNGAGTLTLNGTMTVTDGKWHHIAFVYDGTNYKLYIDGILNVSQALAAMSQTARVHNIGSDIRNSRSWVGHISNFRIVNGTALYSSNFVPSTSPLTAITGTAILTCMDSYHTERITPFTRSVAGVPSIKSFTPFSSTIPSTYSKYGSAYLSTSGLSNAAFTGANFGTSADFTIESWMKWGATTASNQTSYEFNGTTRTIIGRSSTGLRLYLNGTEKGFAYTFIPNVWYHIAVVRSLLTYYVYINGVLATTAFTQAVNYSSTTLTIGKNYDAAEPAIGLSLSDFRVVNGTAVYGGNFIPPTEPLTAITNTTLLTLQNDKEIVNSTFYDDSSAQNLLTTTGTPTQGTFSPISANGWSTYFNGSTDHLTVANTTSLNLTDGAPDWTIEARVYCTALTAADQTIINKDGVLNTSYSQYGIGISSVGVIKGTLGTGGGASGGDSDTSYGTAIISLNTWTHIAFVNKAGIISLYVNGILNFSGAIRGMRAGTGSLYIGYQNGQATANRFNGFITDVRIIRGYAAYTSNFTPSTIPLTAITGTSVLACQDNRFKDNSVNSSAITIVGTPSIQPFSPYYPSQKTIGTTIDYVGYSNYFNGSTDYLSTPSGIASFGSGSTAYAFTAEAWFNTSAPATGQTVISKYASGASGWAIRLNASKLIVYLTGDTTNIIGTTTIVAGTWYHVALSGSPGNWKLFLNGVQEGSTQTSSVTLGDGAGIQIGRVSNVVYFIGYIASVRVVLNVILYTTTFTPPTAPLTAIPGTILLTCQDSLFQDLSGNSVVITVAGTPKISTTSPFTTTTSTSYDILDNGSMYFNGSTDKLSLSAASTAFTFGTGDFTVEYWVRYNAISAVGFICGNATTNNGLVFGITSGGKLYMSTFSTGYTSTGVTLVTNQWYHIAFVRQNGVVKFYVNGVLDYTATIATDCTELSGSIGTGGTLWSNCYVSNIRVIKGIAFYITPFTPSTVLRDVPGTVLLLKGNNAGIYDATGRNNLVTVGDVKVNQVIKKYGNNSLYFDSTGDYLTIPSSPNFAVGTGNYTFEAWIYPIASSGSIFETAGGIQIGYQSTTQFGIAQRGVAWKVFTSTAPTLNAWSHIAVVRFGTGTNQTAVFVNGVAIFGTDAVNYGTAAGTATVGSTSGGGSNYFNGYIDDPRFTRGLARYTAAFTPPPRLGLVP